MKDLKIYSAIKSYAKHAVRFHMPGHKGKNFLKFNASLDVTELPAIDNAKVVDAAECDVADILGAKKVFFLSDGSTCGILSAICAVKCNGGKMAVNRSAHKSVYNAFKIFGIQPVIINGDITPDALAEVFNDNAVIGAVLTYPDYYGKTFDLVGVKNVCDSFGRILITDSAHGNHFKFLGIDYAGQVADISVESLHKTAYSFNQGAIICVNNEKFFDAVEKSVKTFSTSSPSYPILASIEYGVKCAFKNKGRILKGAAAANAAKQSLKNAGLNVLDVADPFKITVLFKKSGYDGLAVEKYLESKKIFSEMYSENEILFMASPATTRRQYKKLVKYVLGAVKKMPCGYVAASEYDYPIRKTDYLTAVQSDCELTPINSAQGKICAENFGMIPPCEPMFVAGEIIDERIKNLHGETFGVYYGKVRTVKGNNHYER